MMKKILEPRERMKTKNESLGKNEDSSYLRERESFLTFPTLDNL